MEEEDECKIDLGLGIGGTYKNFISPKPSPIQFHILFPPCTKDVKEEEIRHEHDHRSRSINIEKEEEDEEEEQFTTRKKLRLTKDQSTLLEYSFREHNTLNLTQKQELAERLNLRPRQVEVWFQNRRARSKLKQIEVDFELMKKCCERLSDENRRMRRELQELRLMVTMCPSCKRVATDGGLDEVATSGAKKL